MLNEFDFNIQKVKWEIGSCYFFFTNVFFLSPETMYFCHGMLGYLKLQGPMVGLFPYSSICLPPLPVLKYCCHFILEIEGHSTW